MWDFLWIFEEDIKRSSENTVFLATEECIHLNLT